MTKWNHPHTAPSPRGKGAPTKKSKRRKERTAAQQADAARARDLGHDTRPYRPAR